jgi:hypothetical protein
MNISPQGLPAQVSVNMLEENVPPHPVASVTVWLPLVAVTVQVWEISFT